VPFLVKCNWKIIIKGVKVLNCSPTTISVEMCSSRKYPYPPHGRLTEIPRGRGVSKAQFSKGKYGTIMEFPEWVGGSS